MDLKKTYLDSHLGVEIEIDSLKAFDKPVESKSAFVQNCHLQKANPHQPVNPGQVISFDSYFHL
jgi:hypothetical protein